MQLIPIAVGCRIVCVRAPDRIAVERRPCASVVNMTFGPHLQQIS